MTNSINKLKLTLLQTLAVTAGLLGMSGCTHQASGAQTPFVLKSLVGRCADCNIAMNLGFIQFTDQSNAWAIGNSSPPTDAQGQGEHVVIHTKDGGITWVELSETAQYGIPPFVSFLDRLKGWIIWWSPFLKPTVKHTTDGGSTWQYVRTTFEQAPIIIDDSRWYGVEDGKLMRSNDGGYTWSKTDVPHLKSIDRIFFLSRDVGWIISVDEDAVVVFRTTDGGNTWSESRIMTSETLTGVKDLFFRDSNQGWLIASHSLERGSDLFSTIDGGRTWMLESDHSFQGRGKFPNIVRFFSEDAGFVFETELSAPNSLRGFRSNLFYKEHGEPWKKQPLPQIVNYCQLFQGRLQCSAEGDGSGLNILTVIPN